MNRVEEGLFVLTRESAVLNIVVRVVRTRLERGRRRHRLLGTGVAARFLAFDVGKLVEFGEFNLAGVWGSTLIGGEGLAERRRGRQGGGGAR